jgi:CubicO group peptidase (beta-lactamase class C family)
VACSLDNAREVELAAALGVRLARCDAVAPGEVQDGNARFLGGLPGHAGLFAPPEALWRLGVAWLRPGDFLPAAVVDAALGGRGPYRLGWWSRAASPVEARPLSRSGFGHPGFTGGSLWIDPQADRVAVLLAHRRDATVDLAPWRLRFHRLALAL